MNISIRRSTNVNISIPYWHKYQYVVFYAFRTRLSISIRT